MRALSTVAELVVSVQMNQICHRRQRVPIVRLAGSFILPHIQHTHFPLESRERRNNALMHALPTPAVWLLRGGAQRSSAVMETGTVSYSITAHCHGVFIVNIMPPRLLNSSNNAETHQVRLITCNIML